MTQAKQREFSKITKAFGLKEDQLPGSSFDFQAQRVERLKRLEEKRNKLKYSCPYEDCGKVYEHKQLLDRHLKYKHTDVKKAIKD